MRKVIRCCLAVAFLTFPGGAISAENYRQSPNCKNRPLEKKYIEAEQSFSKGKAAQKNKQFKDANRFFDLAIQSLGDDYLPTDPINDDSGMALVDARYREKQGDLAGSADLKEGTVRTRLSLYRYAHHCAN